MFIVLIRLQASPWRRRQCSISGCRAITRPASLSASHTVGIMVGRAGLVSYYLVLAGNIPFSLLHRFQWSIMVCQQVFSFVGEQLFFISRSKKPTIASTQLRYTAPKLGSACCLLFREVEGVDTQPVDIVIDMFDASCIFCRKMSQALLSLWETVLHQFPKSVTWNRRNSFQS